MKKKKKPRPPERDSANYSLLCGREYTSATNVALWGTCARLTSRDSEVGVMSEGDRLVAMLLQQTRTGGFVSLTVDGRIIGGVLNG